MWIKKILTAKYFWAAVFLVVIARSLLPERELGPEIPVGKAGETLLGSHLVGWENQELSWEVWAKEIWRSKDGREIIFRVIKEAVFFKNSDRENEFAFSADWAGYEEKKKMLIIGGGIKGRIDEGSFTTEKAEINTETKDITVPGAIVFTENDFRVEAGEMKGNLDTEILNFSGEILITEKDYRVRCRSLRYFGKEDRFELEKELEVELEL